MSVVDARPSEATAPSVRATDSASSSLTDAAVTLPPKPSLRPALKSAPGSPRVPLSPALTPATSAWPTAGGATPGTPGGGPRPLGALLAAATGLDARHRAPAAAVVRALQGRGSGSEAASSLRAVVITCAECEPAARAALESAGLDPARMTVVTSAGAVADQPSLVAAATAVARGEADAVFIVAHAPCAAASDALDTWLAGGGRKLGRPPPRRSVIKRASVFKRFWAFMTGAGPASLEAVRNGASVAGGSRGAPRHDADGEPVSLATAVDAVAVGLVEYEWKQLRASSRAAAARRGGVAPALHDFATPSLAREARVRAMEAALAASAKIRAGGGQACSTLPEGCTAAAVADEAARLSVEAVLKGAARTACLDCPDHRAGGRRGSLDLTDAAAAAGGCGGAAAASRLVVAALRLPAPDTDGPCALLRAGWCDVVGSRRVYYFEGGES